MYHVYNNHTVLGILYLRLSADTAIYCGARGSSTLAQKHGSVTIAGILPKTERSQPMLSEQHDSTPAHRIVYTYNFLEVHRHREQRLVQG